jgi:hypothetical protein
MATHHIARSLRSIAIAAGAIALVTSSLGSPASAATSDRGLYGAPNQFASTQLQSQAILGLLSQRIGASKNAVAWLVKQQCANGAFQGYRADTSVPCATSNPATFSGPSADQTAWALMALEAAGREKEAMRAGRWLVSIATEDANGKLGIPSYATGTPDANSTGLALQALNGIGYAPATTKKLQRFLGSLVLPCTDARGGASLYQSGVPGANNSATAQSYFGIAALLPAPPVAKLGGNPPCSKNAVNKMGNYLAKQLSPTGLLSFYPYDGVSYGDTSLAVVALASQGVARQSVAKATTALKANARDWALKDGATNAGALGSLLMVSAATGSNARNFGGVNLIAELTKSETK